MGYQEAIERLLKNPVTAAQIIGKKLFGRIEIGSNFNRFYHLIHSISVHQISNFEEKNQVWISFSINLKDLDKFIENIKPEFDEHDLLELDYYAKLSFDLDRISDFDGHGYKMRAYEITLEMSEIISGVVDRSSIQEKYVLEKADKMAKIYSRCRVN